MIIRMGYFYQRLFLGNEAWFYQYTEWGGKSILNSLRMTKILMQPFRVWSQKPFLANHLEHTTGFKRARWIFSDAWRAVARWNVTNLRRFGWQTLRQNPCYRRIMHTDLHECKCSRPVLCGYVYHSINSTEVANHTKVLLLRVNFCLLTNSVSRREEKLAKNG